MIDSLSAAMTEPLAAVAVANLVVTAVIGIAIVGLLAALLRRTAVRTEERRDSEASAPSPASVAAVPAQPPENRQAMIAAISAAIAEHFVCEKTPVKKER